MSAKTTKSKKKEQNIKSVLMKKALGYDVTETIEEYASLDGEIVLTKKKVTTKNVPPDVSALKLLLEDEQKSLTLYTDEELEEEKQRLLKLLDEQKNQGEK